MISLAYLKEFSSLTLGGIPSWEEIQKMIDFVKVNPLDEVDKTALNNKYISINQYVTAEKVVKLKSDKK